MIGRLALDNALRLAYTLAMRGARVAVSPIATMRGAACVLTLALVLACKGSPEASPVATPTLTPAPTGTPCGAVLDVQPDPSGASISIDGRPSGKAPLQLDVAEGRHLLELSANGYASYTLSVDVACGQVAVIAPQLYDTRPPDIVVDEIPQTVLPDDGLKITAAADDNRAVESMALYVDGRLIYQLAGDRLRHNLDTRALAAGPHAMRIVAVDPSGNAQEVVRFFAVGREDAASTSLVTLPTTTPVTPAREVTLAPTAEAATPTASLAPSPVATNTPAPTPVPAVSAYEDQVTLMMYDYEPALYTDEGAGHPYPLLEHDRVGAPISRSFGTIVLQNEYLQLVIIPELGGRIYQCRFLPTGQPLLYNSRVAKPTHWGPADQGWWLAVGGIEWALPVDEHGYLSAQPWGGTIVRESDGSATAVMQILEATRGLLTRVYITLRPGEAAIRLRVSIANTSGTTQQFQYWTNAMLSPGRHGVGPELQITYPAERVVVHSTGDNSLPPAGVSMTWPLYAGRDLSSYGEWRNWLGVFGTQRSAPFAGVYDRATQIGMVQASGAAVLTGSKLFGFGRDFDDSAYSDDGAQYLELWSGVTPTFWDNTSLTAGATLVWTESWYVVSQSGGITFANERASLYAWRDGDTVRVTVAAPGEHRWRLITAQNGIILSDQVFDVRPDTPYRAALLPEDGSAQIELKILDLEDTAVLEYVF